MPAMTIRVLSLVALGGVMASPALAQTGRTADTARQCAAVYQVDWTRTTSPERSAADRKGAEISFEAFTSLAPAGTDVGDAVTRTAREVEEASASGGFDLQAAVASCDATWGGEASARPADYAPAPAKRTPAPEETDVAVFENTERPAPSAPPGPSRADQCQRIYERLVDLTRAVTSTVLDYAERGERAPSWYWSDMDDRLDRLKSDAGYDCGDLPDAIEEGRRTIAGLH